LRRSPGVRFVEKHAISAGVAELSVDLFQYFVRGLAANAIAQLWLVTITAISKRHITLHKASIVLVAIYEGMVMDVREKLIESIWSCSGWEIREDDRRKASRKQIRFLQASGTAIKKYYAKGGQHIILMIKIINNDDREKKKHPTRPSDQLQLKHLCTESRKTISEQWYSRM